MDMPVVVSCMPGAELIETIDATHWKTKLAVKVGPISLVFAADLERETADVDSGRMVMTSKARESKGRGGATTRIESVMESVADGTRILIVTDVALSGTAAQFGRPVMQQVSHQLVAKFAEALRATLAAGETPLDQPVTTSSGAQTRRPMALSISLWAALSTFARHLRRRR